ncbi:hypothetical protein, partial [Micromonospora sp. NPDC051296]|uniref:hypothetical protein n=1 Tax=Micromonospora sp. NPDC051296 TaxID=3155046 RepID=UPI00341239EF
VDSWHGWALFDTCGPDEDSGRTDCWRDLARTVDRGENWQLTALPAAANLSGPVYLLPVDDRTVTVVVSGGYLVTTDGGVSFTEHPAAAPPPATRLGVATRSGFLLQCPGGNGVADPPCSRLELARVDSVVPSQPPVTLPGNSDRQLIESGDGRLWLAVREGDRLTVVVSADGAATWRKLPAVKRAERLLVSPDGRDTWLEGIGEGTYNGAAMRQIWQLVGDGWQIPLGLPPDTKSVAATNGETLVLTDAEGFVSFWINYRYFHPLDTPRSGWIPASVHVLPDDTVTVVTSTSTILGTGPGVERSWTHLSY